MREKKKNRKAPQKSGEKKTALRRTGSLEALEPKAARRGGELHKRNSKKAKSHGNEWKVRSVKAPWTSKGPEQEAKS